MLASITPLGERGRQSRWAVTVSAFLFGSVAGGAAIGALAGGLGALVLPASFGVHARLAVFAGALAAAIALDLRGDPAPGPRRQVNERWLQEYRGWVYGGGYGLQLGLGVTTVVSSAATYVVLIAALEGGNVARGALIAGCFGSVRGMTLLAAARVDAPERLFAFHARMQRARGTAARVGPLVLAVLAGLAIAGAAR